MKFNINAKDGNARAAELTINGKYLETPAFMTIGTYGSVKTLDTSETRA